MLLSFSGEHIIVINADAFQVYRGLRIGVAAPDSNLLRRVPHDLVAVRDPKEQFTCGEFVREAKKSVKEAHKGGRLPLLCGGCAFYLRSFLYGIPDIPPIPSSIRSSLQKKSTGDLYEELGKCDPLRAAEISATDRQRISRSLEVFNTMGRSIRTFKVSEKLCDDYEILVLNLCRPREELYARINARVEEMFEEGLVDEVNRLIDLGYNESTPAMKGIGYAEFFQLKRQGADTEENLKELIARNTRRYAKRQILFFKSIPGALHFHPDEKGKILATVRKFIEK